jgi:hypothetical protein
MRGVTANSVSHGYGRKRHSIKGMPTPWRAFMAKNHPEVLADVVGAIGGLEFWQQLVKPLDKESAEYVAALSRKWKIRSLIFLTDFVKCKALTQCTSGSPKDLARFTDAEIQLFRTYDIVTVLENCA